MLSLTTAREDAATPRLPAPLTRFNTALKGAHLTLSRESRRVTRDGTTGFDAAVLGAESVDSYAVRLVAHCENLTLGFAPNTISLDGPPNHTRTGFFFCCRGGQVYQQGDGSLPYAGGSCHLNDTVIEASWDRRARTISFAVNGVSRGVAFRNVPQSALFPAFDTGDAGCTFEFVAAPAIRRPPGPAPAEPPRRPAVVTSSTVVSKPQRRLNNLILM